MKMRCRRGLALFLVFVMCMGMMQGMAFAEETTDTGGDVTTEVSNDSSSGTESTPSADPGSSTESSGGAADPAPSTEPSGGAGDLAPSGSDTQEKDGGTDASTGSESKPETTTTGPTTTPNGDGTSTTTSGEKTEWKDGNGTVVAEKDTSTSQTVKDSDGTVQSETKSEEYHEGPTESTETIQPEGPADPDGTTDPTTPETPGEPGKEEGPGGTGTPTEPGTSGSEGGDTTVDPEGKPEEKPGEPTDVKDWTVVDKDGNPILGEDGEPLTGKDGVTVEMTPGNSDWVGITVDSDKVAEIIQGKMESEKPEGVEISDYKDESTGEEGFQFTDAEGKTHIVIKVMDPTTNKLVGYKKMIITTTTTPGDSGATDGTQTGEFETDDPNAPPVWDQSNKGGTVTKIDLPERPQASETVDEATGNKTTITVEELYDVDEAGNIVRDGEGDPVVVGYLTKTIVTDGTGNQLSGSQEAVWGIRTTVVTNGDTTATTEDQMNVSTSVSFVTKATTIEGFQVNVKDVVGGSQSGVWGSMGEVKEGEHKEDEIKDMAPEVSEPEEGKTDTDTDLYHREDAQYVGYIVTVSALNIRKNPGADDKLNPPIGSVQANEKVYVYSFKQIGGKLWGEIGKDQWVRLEGYSKSPFELTVHDSVLYDKPNGSTQPCWPKKGETLNILEWKSDDNGVKWGRVIYHKKTQWEEKDYEGWVKLTDAYGESQVKPQADKEGQYVFLGEYGLESAIKVNGVGSTTGTWQPHQFLIWDHNGDPVYVYCADFGTDPKKGTDYGKVNIEDVINSADTTIWDKDDPANNSNIAKHVQAIASNGFWGTSEGMGSLDKVKEMLKAAIEQKKVTIDGLDITVDGAVDRFVGQLTEGMALTATQAAIWSHATSDRLINVDDPFGRYQQNGSIIDWNADKEKKDVAMALYTYLRGLDPDKAEFTSNKITEESIKGTSITVKSVVLDDNGKPQEAIQRDDTANKEYTYNTDVSFILSVKPSQINDDLVVTIFDPKTNEVIATRRLAGDGSNDEGFHSGKVIENADGTYTYTIEDVKLNEGTNITLRLQGVRTTAQAYLITAKTPGGVDKTAHSQTFVSATETKQDVNLSFDLKFNVREPVVTVEKTETEEKELVSTVKRDWDKTSETKYTYKTPEDPKDPENPREPDRPNTPNTPTTPTRVHHDRSTPIPDAPTPLASITEDPTPLAMLPEEPVPLAIFDEDVPLASVPATGDISGLWYVLTLFAGLGLMGMGVLSGKKRKDA